jgi:hypothetical protein
MLFSSENSVREKTIQRISCVRKRSKCSVDRRNIPCARVQVNRSRDSDSKVLSNLSPESVTQLFRESHFTTATSNMTQLGKAFLHLYLNVMTNGPIISDFIEKIVAISHTVEDGNITSTTLSNLETVAGTVNSLLEKDGRSNQSLCTTLTIRKRV